MVFGRDGIRIALRDALEDLDVGDIEFVASGSALIGADFAFDDDARFLGEAFDGVEDFGGTAFLGTTPWMMPLPSRNWGRGAYRSRGGCRAIRGW